MQTGHRADEGHFRCADINADDLMLMQIVGQQVDIKKRADRLLKCSEAYQNMDVKLNENHPTSEFYLQYWCWVVPRDDADSCIVDDDDVFDIEEWRVHLADFTQESRNEDFFDPERSLRSFISEKIQSDDTAEIDSIIDGLVENMILPRNNPGRGRPPVNKSWNKDYACWVVDPQRIDSQEEQDKYADVNADLRQLYEESYKKPFDQQTAQTKFNQVLEKNKLSVDELKEASILPYSHISDRSDFVGAYLDTDLACMVKRDMRKRSRSEVQSKEQQPKRSRIETPPKAQEKPNKIRQELVVTQVLTQFRIMLNFFNEQKTLLTVLKNNIKMMEKLVKHKEMFQLTLNQIESFAELAMSEASDEMQRHSVQAFIGTIKLVKEYFK